jgi:cytochrome c peroxidase
VTVARKKSITAIAALLTIVALAAGAWHFRPHNPAPWTDADVEILRSLWIGSLPPLGPDPSNAVADDLRAAKLGQRLFFESRMSANGAVSCASCHQPERRFTDGLPKGQGVASSKRNTPSIVGVAYSPWLYWDGRKDSLWSQALAPLEDVNEHGSDRAEVVALVTQGSEYREDYEILFGAFDPARDDAIDVAFANVGKTIAAFERLLLPSPSRFDDYVEALLDGNDSGKTAVLSTDEILGLQLFIGEAGCTQCHNSPLLTNNEFHNTGVISFPGEVPDKGRTAGVREVLVDPFNCIGNYSDDAERVCTELEYARTGPELLGAFRTPSLRNLEDTEPYMHKGQFNTLAETLQHYNDAPPAMIGHNEAEPLGLSRRQLQQLEAFLKALTAPLATDKQWLAVPTTNLAGSHENNQQR